jgi:hypothetical protein
MRFIPTGIHAFLDYAMGVLLIASPWLFNFDDAARGWPAWIVITLGILVILYSLMTNYELGVIGAISMPTHLYLDAVGGLLLAVSPWLFMFYESVWVPHVVLGVLEIGAAVCTKTVPSRFPRGTPGAERATRE